MKTFIISTAVMSAALTSCIQVNSEKGDFTDLFSSNKGHGPITEKTYEGNIDRIKVSTSINAEVYKSDAEKVVISAPSDIMEYIKVDNSGGNLRIYVHSGFGKSISTQKVRAKIFVKDFSEISADSSADISVKDTFTQNKMKVKVSSSGYVEVQNLEANDFEIETNSSGDFSGKIWAVNLNAEASSSGDINIYGEAKNATLEANSSGDVKASELKVENANLEASSSGNISVAVTQNVNAKANSSGEITVFKKGNLEQLKIDKNSGGDVYVK
jgi:hypothetical protein